MSVVGVQSGPVHDGARDIDWVLELARPGIRALKAYEHASWEHGLTRMHANELPWRVEGDPSEAGLNRYPEPQPAELVARLAALYGVPQDRLLVGRGSDEAIDLVLRIFCEAGRDSVIVCPPTFGMYAVFARIQGARVITVPLAEHDFSLDVGAITSALTPDVRIVFLCSPNNPTGNLLQHAAVMQLAETLKHRALLVVDEAYLEFAGATSLADELDRLPHLVLLRTLSKAHGLAGARCGSLIARPEIIGLARKVISPYAISQLTVETACALLQQKPLAAMRASLATLVAERMRLATALAGHREVLRVWPSDANFLLVEFTDPGSALDRARAAGLVVRDVRGYPGLGSCLRITIGTPEQNDRLLRSLQ